MARLFVGTSGWNYYEWRGIFFPEELPARKWLSFYSRNFQTVEVNYSFYHLPRDTTYQNWYSQTPDNFIFALKCSRFITHIKRLHDVRNEWKEFIKRADTLKEKLGPILLQFPPSFRATDENTKLVDAFLSRAIGKRRLRLAMEFRHESCFGVEMTSILREHGAALVTSHSQRYPVPEVSITGDFAYFRFHGPKDLFASSYSESELRKWGAQMKALLRKGCDVYAYFNNDVGGYAINNARTLVRIVG